MFGVVSPLATVQFLLWGRLSCVVIPPVPSRPWLLTCIFSPASCSLVSDDQAALLGQPLIKNWGCDVSSEVSVFVPEFHHSVHDDVSRKRHTSRSFTNPFLCRILGLHEVVFVCMRRKAGWQRWGTIVSAVLTKLSVLLGSMCLWLLSPPPPTHPHCLSLSNAHPRGQLSVRVILYILCGKGQRGALRLTPSLPREKVWCSKNQRKTTASRLAFTQRAVRSIPSACLPLISGCTVLRDSLLLLLITVQCITATWYSSFPSNYKDNLQNLD